MFVPFLERSRGAGAPSHRAVSVAAPCRTHAAQRLLEENRRSTRMIRSGVTIG